MYVYFLSLGSNKGDRRWYLREAISRLANAPAAEPAAGAPGGAHRRVRVLAVASLYETAPVGYIDQADFLNTVVAVTTEADPPALLALCKKIEEELGRDTPFRWGPREIDLDLVWWGEVTGEEELGDGAAGSLRASWTEGKWESPTLVIPHPRATERLFVLIPLAEIAPGLPIHGQPVESWVTRCRGRARQGNDLPAACAEAREQVVRKIAAPDWYSGVGA